MSSPFLGEIRATSFNFAPVGWHLCDGSLLPINQNQALFSILGVQYGGDGRTSFALPDLRGRTPVHADGQAFVIGMAGGEAAHTLIAAEIPAHAHPMQASTDFATVGDPGGAAFAARPRGGPLLYVAAGNNPLGFAPAALASSGGSQPHSNLQPSLVINFIIAMAGIFPSRA